MNLHGISWNSKFIHWHSTLVTNKRRSRNSEGKLVLKKHYEHKKIDAQTVKKAFENDAIPWMKEQGIKLAI